MIFALCGIKMLGDLASLRENDPRIFFSISHIFGAGWLLFEG